MTNVIKNDGIKITRLDRFSSTNQLLGPKLIANQKDRESFPDLFRFLFHSYSTLKRYGYTGC